MQNFLEIVSDACIESGVSIGPSSISAAVGTEKRMVGWVRQSWKDIQQYRSDWPWMINEFTFNTSPDKQTYSVVELSLTDVERWIFDGASIYKTADGSDTEMSLGSTIYNTWWSFLRIGLQTPTQPDRIFFNPVDNTLMLYPIPDDEYTIILRYYRALQSLTEDGDIPLMPTNAAWQEIIKWRALWLYGFHDGAPAILDEAEILYEQMIHALDNRFGQIMSLIARPVA